ncbi:YkoF family thiamine/hydroxymethylpyrimidine-binding protein [Ureibacillus sp. GCM10028918]|uniref:YkoF family thiamine/hydroxymethylpyrimidine-binding protein n=1 Tax=Ureibacillus sp. GCM10028918 TaxID=3273429 RepID=UPI003610F68E
MTNQSCGASKIAGASFSLHPMSDDFIDIITSALKEVDTTKVWMKTDDVTTTVRGKVVHVFDVTSAIFLNAAKSGKHIAFQATYSLGCPGDSEGDVYLAKDDQPANALVCEQINQHIAAKFSLYPLGNGSYMDVIYQQIEAIKEYASVTPAHYSTRLDGDASKICKGLQTVFEEVVNAGSSHTVMTVSFSANSPSHRGTKHE